LSFNNHEHIFMLSLLIKGVFYDKKESGRFKIRNILHIKLTSR